MDFYHKTSLTYQPDTHTKNTEKFLSKCWILVSIDKNDNKGSLDFYHKSTLAFLFYLTPAN